MRCRARALCLGACALFISSAADAGGLQLSTRGVRSTARAGAFVAGADDLGAMWFNPAGLALLGSEGADHAFLLDVGFVKQTTEYLRLDSGNNWAEEPVRNESPGLPVPTVAVSWNLGALGSIGAGVYAPYAALGRYPEDGPQRYSLIDMSESLLVISEVAWGMEVASGVRLGAGLQNMVFQLSSTIVFSGCPGETVCEPESRDWDALSKVSQLDMFNPSGVLGIQIDAHRSLRLGAAFQLPFRIAGQGSFQTRLPPAGFFDGATVVGDRADVSFTLPMMMRAGIELAPTQRWRLELSADYEFWSQHDKFAIEPRGVRIEGSPGVPSYEVGPMEIVRNFEDTMSIALGVEGQPLAKTPLMVLAGYSFETGASPDAYLSVLTVDGSKHLFSGGLGYRLGRLQICGTLAVVSVEDRSVTMDVGKAQQLAPIREGEFDTITYVNWGNYSSSWLVAGVGVSGGF